MVRARFPPIADVRCFLLVFLSVGEADRKETPRLIEAARPGIGLKAPQFERAHSTLFCGFDQLRPRRLADAVWTCVEKAHFFALEREKRDNTAIVLGYDHLTILQDHIRDKPPVLRDGMQFGQKTQQPERRAEHGGDRIGVIACRTPECEGSGRHGSWAVNSRAQDPKAAVFIPSRWNHAIPLGVT